MVGTVFFFRGTAVFRYSRPSTRLCFPPPLAVSLPAPSAALFSKDFNVLKVFKARRPSLPHPFFLSLLSLFRRVTAPALALPAPSAANFPKNFKVLKVFKVLKARRPSPPPFPAALLRRPSPPPFSATLPRYIIPAALPHLPATPFLPLPARPHCRNFPFVFRFLSFLLSFGEKFLAKS